MARNLFENHPTTTYQKILDAIRASVPGDGRLVLQFGNGIFKAPFSDRFVSDGTLKMFAYLVLHDKSVYLYNILILLNNNVNIL